MNLCYRYIFYLAVYLLHKLYTFLHIPLNLRTYMRESIFVASLKKFCGNVPLSSKLVIVTWTCYIVLTNIHEFTPQTCHLFYFSFCCIFAVFCFHGMYSCVLYILNSWMYIIPVAKTKPFDAWIHNWKLTP